MWTEEVSASGESSSAGAVADRPRRAFAAVEALAALEQTRPFGIEDYELAACGAEALAGRVGAAGRSPRLDQVRTDDDDDL
ncbi:MAG: hypothetical protein ACLSVD_05875 [Eggerthellaceae bacterium]